VFAWVHFGGMIVGHVWAMRSFIALTIAANAYAFPRLLLEVGGRRKMVVGSFFLAPMVHNWFVSMGMLDFALGVALSLVTLTAMQRQQRSPSVGGAALVTLAGFATWYAHVFPLMLLHLLVAIEVAVVARRSWPDAIRLCKVA